MNSQKDYVGSGEVYLSSGRANLNIGMLDSGFSGRITAGPTISTTGYAALKGAASIGRLEIDST